MKDTFYKYVLKYIIKLAIIKVICNLYVIECSLNKECPIGYVSKGDLCILCPSGTFLNKDNNSCISCGEGKYSYPGSYSPSLCIPCSIGFYSSEKETSACESCPNLQITPKIGSVSKDDCFCTPGHKPASLRNETCIECLEEEWCFLYSPTSGGFWNVASYCLSIDIDEFAENTVTNYLCKNKSLINSPVASFLLPCFGNEYQCLSLLRDSEAIKDNNIDSLMVSKCVEGNTGILCDSCENGYGKFESISNKIYSCSKCEFVNYIPNILIHVLTLSMIIYSVWILRLEPTANEEEMPIVQITLLRSVLQHIQVLSLLMNFKIISFEYLPKISIAFMLLGSHVSILPIFQCVLSFFNIPINGSDSLKLYALVSATSPLLLILFSLILAPIMRYFRQREVRDFLLGRQEMEGECLYFQKSFFAWFFSIFIVSFFFYFSNILQSLASIFYCITLNIDINNPTYPELNKSESNIDTLDQNNLKGIPGSLMVVNIAKDNICWSSDHKLAIYIATGGVIFWIFLIPAIYTICIMFDTKMDKIQRRRLVFGWWTSGYEITKKNIWELYSTWSQVIYLIVVLFINSFNVVNHVLVYYGVPGGSIYESKINIYTPILTNFCCFGITVILDSIYSAVRPHDKEISQTGNYKLDIASLGTEDDLLTEDQKQKQRVAFGGSIITKQTKKLNWNSYYYFTHRVSSFSLLSALFASMFPRLNVNIKEILSVRRQEWLSLTNVNPTPVGYNDTTTYIFTTFALLINYLFVFSTIFSVVGIKIYRKIISILSSKPKVEVNINSMSDFSDSIETMSGANKKLKKNEKITFNEKNRSRFYHDMNKSSQIGDQDGEGVDDEISIEQLIRMHLRTDCLNFLTHEDRVSIVVAIKRCDNRQEGVAIALRATLDSRFGESGKFTQIENIGFICDSLRSYGFSDLGLEKLIEDLLEIHILITNRIKTVTKNILKMVLDLCIINYPEVAQKLGIEQIIPTDIDLNNINEKSNVNTNNNNEALYSLGLRRIIARLSMNALILDISDLYFRIPRSIPVIMKLKMNKSSGLLFSETGIETNEFDSVEVKYDKKQEILEPCYKVPIPGYIEEEYNEPRSLDVDLMLSIKKLTDGDPRKVLEETHYPLAFEKTSKYADSSNHILEVLFSILSTELDNNSEKMISEGNNVDENHSIIQKNQDEELIQLLLGINPDENIGTDAVISLLKDLDESVVNNLSYKGFSDFLDSNSFKSNLFNINLENNQIARMLNYPDDNKKHTHESSKSKKNKNLSEKDDDQVKIKNKMSPQLKNTIYNLYLLRVLDLKEWLTQYREQYIEESKKHMESIRMNNYLNYDNSMLIVGSDNRDKNRSHNSNVNNSNMDNNSNNNNNLANLEKDKISLNNEINENIKSMASLVSHLNRYASPSMLFYYLQLCKRLKLGADFKITSLIPDNLLDKGVISSEEAIRLYREINPSLNFSENPNGFDIAAIHEFSALNTPNLNLKRELELTIEYQREFNLIFPSALPCIHSIFWVPYDIYDDDNLWIIQSNQKQNMVQLMELISKDHPQLIELPYIDEEIIEEKLECVELDKNDQSLVKQTLNILIPQVSDLGGIENGTWLWNELPLRFAIDLNGLTIRRLYSSSNYPKSIYLSGSPLSVLGPQSPQWAYMSHKSDRINYLNGVCTLNNCLESNTGDNCIIVAPGVEIKGTSFTIEVWVKLPPLIDNIIREEKGNQNNKKDEKTKSKQKSKSKSKSRSKQRSKNKTGNKLNTTETYETKSKKKDNSISSISRLQKKIVGLRIHRENQDDMEEKENALEDTKSDANEENGYSDNNADNKIQKRKFELPTLQVLCSTDSMEGLFTIHRPTGTIGFWDSNGRFLKCVIKNNLKENKTDLQYKNNISSITSNVATLQSIYSQLGLKKKSTYCRETNQDIEQFINYNEDPWILEPWVLVHIVYNMGSIKYYVNGRYIGSIRKVNGLKGDIAVIGGGLESGSSWGYFSQFRVYGNHTTSEQIKRRYESYVSSNSDSSFVTKINKLTTSTINWALTLWRSGAIGFFIWKYSHIKLKKNDVTYLIDLINRKNNVLNNGDIIEEEEDDDIDKGKKTKSGILIFGIIIRILKGERTFPYYYVYEPLPYIENIYDSGDNKNIGFDNQNNDLTKIRYKMTSVTSQLSYRVTEDYKKIQLDNENLYRMNPLLYQPNIVPGPGMAECLLLAFNTKSNNSGLLITPSIELQRKKKNKTNRNNRDSKKNLTDITQEDNNAVISELYNGWTITIWFHYPLLTNYSYTISNMNEDDNLTNNLKKKSNSDIDHYIVLVTGKNDSHIIINENMDVGVYRNFSQINNSQSSQNNQNINNKEHINISINNVSNHNNYNQNNNKLNIDKGFYSSGLNLKKANLPIGWHMMSVVGKPRMIYTKIDNKERNIIGGGGLGYTEITKQIQKSTNLITKYKWCQEFYLDGQIMGISSYCTHENIVMIGNSLYLENAFGIFTCPRIYNRSFSPLEIHTDFLSYNYLIKASSWNSKDDILMQFDYNQIVNEFQVLENPSNKTRYLYDDNSIKNNNVYYSPRDKRNKKKKLLNGNKSDPYEKSYWLDEMEYQSPLYNYIETFLSSTNNNDIILLSNPSEKKNIIAFNNKEDNRIQVKNNGIITIHRGPTNENICIDPIQIFMLEKKSGYSTEGGSIILEKSVRLSKNWSCEVWFYVPFEITYHPYCLLSNNDVVGFIVIGPNGELGSIQRRNNDKLNNKKLNLKTSGDLHFMSWDINIRDYIQAGWYHMVVVFNTTQNNTITTYINSQCIGKKTNLVELPHHQSPWIDCIGNLKSNKGNYIAPFGLFGHLKIYDFALSSIEVGLLYKNWMSHKNLKKEILYRHVKQEKSAITKVYTLFKNTIKKDEDENENENNDSSDTD